MLLSIFRRLGLGEARPTTVTLQLADRSLKHPRGGGGGGGGGRHSGQSGQVHISGIFHCFGYEEDKEIPIILGRPFLATGRALIDVQKGELKLRVQDDEVTFNVLKAMRHPT